MQRYTHTLCALIAAIYSAFVPGAAASENTPPSLGEAIAIGVDGAWPPIDYFDEQGQHRGIAADYIAYLNKTLGIQLQAQSSGSFKAMLQRVSDGDLKIGTSIARTPEREKKLWFSAPFFTVHKAIVARESTRDIHTLQDLHGRTVAIEDGFSTMRELQSLHPKIKLLLMPDTASALEAVAFGRADAYVGTRAVSQWIMRERQLSSLRLRGDPGLGSSGQHFVVPKQAGLRPLFDAIDQAIKEMPDEQKRAIEARWLTATPPVRQLTLSPEEQAWVQQHPVVRVGGETGWAPFGFIDEAGHWRGITPDYLYKALALIGVRGEPVTTPNWNDSLEMLKRGELDLMGSMVITDKRLEYLTFSDSYIFSPYALVHRADDATEDTLEALKTQRLVVEKGYYLAGELERLVPTANITLTANTQQALTKIAAGEADVYVGNRSVAAYLINQYQIPGLQVSTSTLFPARRLHFGVRKDLPMLASLLSRALAEIPPLEQRNIENRWLGPGRDNYIEMTPKLSANDTQWLNTQQQLITAIPAEHAPLSSRQGIDVEGLTIDYARLLDNTLGDRLELRLVPQQQLLKALQSGGVDLLAGVSQHPDLAAIADFSIPFARIPQVLFAPADRGNIVGLDSLKGKTLLVEQNNPVIPALRQQYPDIQLLPVASQAIAIDQLSRGSANAYIGNLVRTRYKLIEQGLTHIQVVAPTPFSEDLRFAVRRGNQQLLSLIDRALESLTAQQRQRIQERWLRIDVDEDFIHAAFRAGLWQTALIGLPILLLLLSWALMLIRQRSALRRSESQLKEILHLIPVGVVIADHQGTIQLDNHQARAIINASASLVGRRTDEFYAHAGTRERLLKILKHQHKLKAEPVSYRTAEGKTIDCLLSSLPIRYQRQTAWLAVIVDLSERLELEKQLEQARDQALQANQFKSRFLANMSHEIRTPMNAIVGLSHLALGKHPGGQIEDYLQKIQSASGLLLGLINDILDLSRIEAGRMELEKAPFRLDQVAAELRELFSAQAQGKGLSLKFQLPPEASLSLQGDALRLKQILVNLLQNALKFTERGSIEMRLRILDKTSDHLITHFSVCDTGIGIARDKQDQLFESFRQADASTTREYGGSGLGLSIAYELVRAMQGQLQVTSAPGQGSEFYFQLSFPISHKAVASPQPAPNPDRPLSGRVLLAEDNELNRLVAREVLMNMGLQVVEAIDGEQAWRRLTQESVDIALLDIQMPRLDGCALTQRIRQDPQLKQLPLVALTAQAMRDERERILACGFDHHVAKPLDPSALYQLLASYLPKQDTASPTNRKTATGRGDELPASLPGVDIPWGLQRIGGNPDLYARLLQGFGRDFHPFAEHVQRAIDDANIEQAKRLAHTLQGVAANLGAGELSEAVRTLEHAISQQDRTLTQSALSVTRKHLDPLLGAIDEWHTHHHSHTPAAQTLGSFERLQTLLAQGSPKARGELRALHGWFIEQQQENAYHDLENLVEAFEFDQAARTLQALLDKP